VGQKIAWASYPCDRSTSGPAGNVAVVAGGGDGGAGAGLEQPANASVSARKVSLDVTIYRSILKSRKRKFRFDISMPSI
jgi:hypothetical protein